MEFIPDKIIALKEWYLVPANKINHTGITLTKTEIDLKDWYTTEVPSTVLATLVKNGIYKDPYFGKNLDAISTEQFSRSWWYRTEFEITEEQITSIAILHLNGINYKANLWLNGKIVADEKTIYGAFRRFQFNITAQLHSGKNTLAIEVIPPKPGDFTIGFVDWNPNPPDNNVGIFRDVFIKFNKGLSIQHPFVESKISVDLQKAELNISAHLENHTNETLRGILKGCINSITFETLIEMEPNFTKQINFSSNDYKQLIINQPKLWWPNNLGEPNLYQLELEIIKDDNIIDSSTIKFGIRQVDDYINEDGHRGFKINGHKVLIKGAGWTDDLFLQDTHELLRAQIEYVRHMNLNSIRLEGFWGKDQTLYNLCDEYGILIMVGWSCQWEHEQYLGKPIDERYGGVIEVDEIDLVGRSWEDQLLWLRHHPSIFVWTVGSDMVPHPDLEKKYIETFNKYDLTRPYLNSTGGVGSEQGIITSTEIVSEISGSSRVKMLGPYAYTPPIYWYTNKNLGGAYGFNTETCPGANVQPLDSIKKMIPNDNLWPIDDVWNFHCGKNEFATLDRFKEAVEKRYGKSEDAYQFTLKAQVLNYELMRPMFEAFQTNKDKATGIIQWMLNSAWPEMYWQLYGHDLLPNGAFYGTQAACKPIHILYNYGNNSVAVINDTFSDLEKVIARITILDINSKVIYKNIVNVIVSAEGVALVQLIPELKEITDTYFLDLRLIDQNEVEIDCNFYWLSTKKDVLDYDAEFESWAFYTPSKEYADYRLLNSLPKVNLKVTYDSNSQNGFNITIGNESESVAFFVELQLFDKVKNEIILPIIWENNYFSLLPNEQKQINAKLLSDNYHSENIGVRIKGWNVDEFII
ncbi:MAG: sugar-binding domain-containing protein [Bacteroidota bacterium]